MDAWLLIMVGGFLYGVFGLASCSDGEDEGFSDSEPAAEAEHTVPETAPPNPDSLEGESIENLGQGAQVHHGVGHFVWDDLMTRYVQRDGARLLCVVPLGGFQDEDGKIHPYQYGNQMGGIWCMPAEAP